MLSVSLDNNGSPKKRTFSRSEDESLRSIIKEAESSSRRLTRSDSRPGTLKRRPDSQGASRRRNLSDVTLLEERCMVFNILEHSDQDPSMGLPEMVELQASYDEAVHELRGLEVEREVLLFQVDVLQDTLEGVEELLAETHREARRANVELEQEREARKKMEHLVQSLMEEVETLKEEKNSQMHLSEHTNETEVDAKRRGYRLSDSAKEASQPTMDASTTPGDEGSVVAKVKWVANSAPSLALDAPLREDGVHRRPFESGAEGRRDPSPDKSDSDSVSTYEDASAETPEHEPVPLELPLGSASKDGAESEEPQNGDNCVVS